MNKDNWLEPAYMPGDRVLIDKEIWGHVVEISVVDGPVITYKVEWFNQGNLCSAWFNTFRLRQ